MSLESHCKVTAGSLLGHPKVIARALQDLTICCPNSKIQKFKVSKKFEISKIQNSKTLRTSSPNANRYLAQLAQLPIACVPRLLVASPLA